MIEGDLDILKRNPSLLDYLILFEKIFDAFYKNLTIGVALVDATSGRIYNANSIYIEKTNINLNEYHNTDINTNCHPDDIKIEEENMVSMRSGEINNFTINKRYIKANGSYTKVKITIIPLIYENQITGLNICIIEDFEDKNNEMGKIKNSQDYGMRWKNDTWL